MKALENTVGKGENAGNQHFLLFPQCFLSIPRENSVFDLHLFCSLQMLSIWTTVKICHLVKRVKLCHLYVKHMNNAERKKKTQWTQRDN